MPGHETVSADGAERPLADACYRSLNGDAGESRCSEAWPILQVADILLPAWGASPRGIQLLVYAALLGFPIALQPMNARFRRAMAEIFGLQGREADARAELEKAAAFAPRQETEMVD